MNVVGQRTFLGNPVIWLAAILCLYLALLLPHVERLGIGWDEQTDIQIARSYLGDWLVGPDSEPSQTRLPMYLVAGTFGAFDTESLEAARLVSCAMGLLTIVAVYLYGLRHFDRHRALLACGILATSPFFLSYSRMALTESGIFVACFMTWTLLLGSIFLEKRTVGWAGLASVALGLAISSKFSAVLLLPGFLLSALVSRHDTDTSTALLSKRQLILIAVLALLSIGAIAAPWSTGILDPIARHSDNPFLELLRHCVRRYSQSSTDFKTTHYVAACSLWLSIMIWSIYNRRCLLKFGTLAVLVPLLSLATFVVVPPAHTTNPIIHWSLLLRMNLSSVSAEYARENFALYLWLARRLAESNGGIDYALRNLAFHFGCVWLKSSPLVGSLLWLSLVTGVLQCKSRRILMLPAILFFVYLLGILRIEWLQSFYVVPLLPILALFASDQWMRLLRYSRVYAFGIAVLCICSLSIDLIRCYPDYNLNGYQWLKEREFAGRSPVGYAGIASIPNDGVEQVFRWIESEVESGATVLAYIPYHIPVHILRAVSPVQRFHIIDGTTSRVGLNSDNVDYVISTFELEVAAKLGLDNPPLYFKTNGYQFYNVDLLEEKFEKVFAVERAFGIEVASVWRAKHR
jgi:hypothetical protein